MTKIDIPKTIRVFLLGIIFLGGCLLLGLTIADLNFKDFSLINSPLINSFVGAVFGVVFICFGFYSLKSEILEGGKEK